MSSSFHWLSAPSTGVRQQAHNVEHSERDWTNWSSLVHSPVPVQIRMDDLKGQWAYWPRVQSKKRSDQRFRHWPSIEARRPRDRDVGPVLDLEVDFKCDSQSPSHSVHETLVQTQQGNANGIGFVLGRGPRSICSLHYSIRALTGRSQTTVHTWP